MNITKFCIEKVGKDNWLKLSAFEKSALIKKALKNEPLVLAETPKPVEKPVEVKEKKASKKKEKKIKAEVVEEVKAEVVEEVKVEAMPEVVEAPAEEGLTLDEVIEEVLPVEEVKEEPKVEDAPIEEKKIKKSKKKHK